MAEEQLSIAGKLHHIQVELKAPKSQYNSFGKYYYRNVEDIDEGLKPLLAKYECAIVCSDEVVVKEGIHYLRATATLLDTNGQANDLATISTTSEVRLEDKKTGMDAAQLSGSTSSYARKYALSGLFAIDDQKDSDSYEADKKGTNKPAAKATPPPAAKPSPNSVLTDTLAKVYKEMREKGYSNKQEVNTILCRFAEVDNLSKLSQQKAEELLTNIQNTDKNVLDTFFKES